MTSLSSLQYNFLLLHLCDIYNYSIRSCDAENALINVAKAFDIISFDIRSSYSSFYLAIFNWRKPYLANCGLNYSYR